MKNIYQVVLYRPDLNLGADKQHASEELYIAANATAVIAALEPELSDESVSFDSLRLIGPVLRDLTASELLAVSEPAGIPAEIYEAALKLQEYFSAKGIHRWSLGPVQSRL